MSAPYRRTSQHGLMWVVMVFTGIACAVALRLMMPKGLPWGWAMSVFFVPIFASIALAVWTMIALRRKRVRGIQTDIEREAFVMDINPDAARKAAVFAPVADLQRRADLRNGSDGVQWVALHTVQPSSICIFEHKYVTGSGKSTQEHFHTVLAWLVSPTNINYVSAFRPHWLQRRILTKQKGVLAIGDDRFDRAWITFGEADGARAFFTESMRLMLEDSPNGESWHIGPNWIACVYDGAFDARNLSLFRRRCAEAVQLSGLAASVGKV